VSCEPSARPPERLAATRLQPKCVRSGGTGWDWLALTGTGRPPVECISIAFCGFSPNCRKLLGEADVPGAYALRLRAL